MKREREELSSVELHSAGAIIRHTSPFAGLAVEQICEPPPQKLIARWIRPFYYLRTIDVERFEQPIAEVFDDIDEALARKLLSYFNWRPRVVGGYLAALRGLVCVEETIGRLLLRSDVCYAARGYCTALVRFNSQRSVAYLCEYLDYYLRREDLWFDQPDAFAALRYLDEVNGTQHAQDLMPLWHRFLQSRQGSPCWEPEKQEESLQQHREHFVQFGELAARLAADKARRQAAAGSPP